ncbi:MAG: mitomycin resistance protein [Gammaproteobacteria bacterium]|nr:mitomycin resistance protein [Gammaproteobacteria bacterium]
MTRKSLKRLVDIPNIGKAMERDLVLLGIECPIDLIGRDPYQLYEALCRVTDPCVLDIFISAVRYMEGGPPKKWWEFTEERKRKL